MKFDAVVNAIIAREGDYVDHPSDRGGPTRFGITRAVAQANSYFGDMRLLPLSLAQDIYLKRYILIPQFDKVHSIAATVGAELIDTGINMGPAVAAGFLQRWLNAFNARGSRYPDMFVDSRIGPITLRALQKYVEWRGVEGIAVLVTALNATQAMHYLSLAEAKQSQEDFIYGWLRTRVHTPA